MFNNAEGKEVSVDVSLQDTKVSGNTDLAHDLQHKIIVQRYLFDFLLFSFGFFSFFLFCVFLGFLNPICFGFAWV